MQSLTLTALTLATLGFGALWMQDKKQERFTHPMPKDPENAMARWIDTCKPTAAHERLKELLGSYDTVMKIWMEPGKPPMELKGSGEFSWLTEGKWLQLQWKGMMMSGKPGTVTWILGYDNFKQRYVTTMVDSLQTCMSTASGHFDQSGDNLILWGTLDEPMTPEQDKQCKYVYRGFGKDKFSFAVHDMMIGESDTRVIEIEYTRKK
ncbi:MAG TPA: DUF1579 family protein [Planctomycetota bacterium]|nr:DUF1579 family protein [Planctomycetota bacterium]